MIVVEGWALLKGLAAIVNDNDFLALIGHIQVVERPVRINYIRLHDVLVCVEPFSEERDRTSAVDKDEAGNCLCHRPDLRYFLPQVRNGENWDGYKSNFVLAQYCLIQKKRQTNFERKSQIIKDISTGRSQGHADRQLTVRMRSAHNESVSFVAKMYIVVPRCSFSSAILSIL